MKKIVLIAMAVLMGQFVFAQENSYQLKSPDGKLSAKIVVDKVILYEVSHEGEQVLAPSKIEMLLDGGDSFGANSKVKNTERKSVDETIDAHFYKRDKITDKYNELRINFKENFSVIFRAYDEAVAYRFVSTGKKDFKVKNEVAEFEFVDDYSCYVPYVKSDAKDIVGQYFNSFENEYTYGKLSELKKDRLSFTPVVVETGDGMKVCIAESDLESYPGMFLINEDGDTGFESNFATVPISSEQGGHNMLQQVVTKRENYIASCKAKTNFPWRIVIVAEEDKELLDSDIVYKLAAENRIGDVSWIKPGKVAWEWWNHWGISGVDFEAGINTATYKAYIDFASKNNIEYVILDEGWAVKLNADLFDVVPEIDLEEIVSYGKSKNVDIILWAGYYAFERDLEKVCKHYSEMGVKGFKIDFMDRDDQEMVDFHYRAAEVAAKYHMLVDFHGSYKPTGMNRTYPNVINYEAVNGLEQMKWSSIDKFDQVTYDVTMPFIRMISGSIDYTQGAMRNATKRTHRGINDEPMSLGTRCRQLAEYVIFESPLNMLCDSPTNYEKEQECTDFIAAIPTVWDNTVAVNGEIAKYITIAREKDGVWYLGAITNWDSRDLEIDLSFLGDGNFKAEVFSDGANANRIASDYKKEIIDIPSNRKLNISMAQGGGYALKIYKAGN